MQRTFRLTSLFIGLLVLAGANTASAQGIDFEEIIASNDPTVVLSDEYAQRGVRFLGEDGSIWHGMSHGDPGGFGLEGTAGPSFLGFDGGTFSTDLHFDPPIRDLTLDLARAEGAGFHLAFLLMGFFEGELVHQQSITFGAVGEWQELALSGEFDEVRLWSIGNVRYGVDDIQWAGGAVSLLAVDVDVMPGSEHNPIKPGRPGMVPVVLFGAQDFDVMEVDPDTLYFGPELAVLPEHGRDSSMVDVDGDGLLDLLTHFPAQACGIDYADEVACLGGELIGGPAFEGCDVVTPVGRSRR
jgi:hypothetical protein